jgi:HlyD family secretion protein
MKTLMKKVVLILLILLLTVVTIWKWDIVVSKWNAFVQAPNDKEEINNISQPKTTLVERGAIRVFVEATGRVVPEQEIEIKGKASGEIIKLPVDISDKVKRGDLLVWLDPEEEERSVKRAEVALTVSKARLEQRKIDLRIAESELGTERSHAEAALKSIEAKVKENKAKLDRVEQLLEKKMASREEYEGVQTAYAQVLAEVESARARVEGVKTFEVKIDSRRQDVKIAGAQVESDKLSLTDSRQRLEDTKIVAPIDGIVVEKNVQVGQIIASGINNVGGGTTMLKLADLSRIYVLVSVDESDVGKVAVGQKAKISVDAYPSMFFLGSIERVATKGTITSNVVTFEVKVEVEGEEKQLLKPEMTANVKITAVEKEDVLLIPVSTIIRRSDKTFVTVKKSDGTLEKRSIEPGVTDGEFIEVISGLNEGEEILLPDEGEEDSRWRQSNGNQTQGDSARDQRRKVRMIGRTLR